MTTDKILYATSNTIAITLCSLASSSTGQGRSSAAVDNSANLYDDALVSVTVKTGTGGTFGNDKAAYIYVYGSEDGTNFDGGSLEAVGTDVNANATSPSNMKGPVVLALINSGITARKTFTIAQFFGGAMPRKWGIFVTQYAGEALSGTAADHYVTYTGINYTAS